MRRHGLASCPRLAAFGLLLCSATTFAQSTLPPVPVPPANPITEPKRVLGKILFWDVQLSSDNTTACGTCHMPEIAGAEPSPARHPGIDNIFNTPDDVFGSRGVISSDNFDNYLRSAPFNMAMQVTSRSANSSINAMFAPLLFWDGRATGQFTDPQTGQVLIPSGGALESQAVGPIVSSVEMAHAGRNWPQVIEKLETAGPLALAADLPPDMAAAIDSFPSYPELFEAAFGTNQITAARIAFAIATYERTLVSDQSPWDRAQRGEPGALTPQQQQGFNLFQATECRICHTPPLFTDNAFHNLALRPNNQDTGRGGITNNPADQGRFKTPSLRNLALRENFMHTGQFTTLNQVFPFYAGPGAPGVPNRDPILPSPVPPQQQPAIIDFLLNGLLDPRVANRQFPFDRPTLHTQITPTNPLLIGGGVAGTGGVLPTMVAVSPPNVGNSGFKIGVDRALPGAQAFVAISTTPPTNGVVNPSTLSDPITIGGAITGQGFATFHWPIPADPDFDGDIYYMQWRINDPGAVGGIALSQVVQIQCFGGEAIVPPDCTGDANGDQSIDGADLSVLLGQFGQSVTPGTGGDINADGLVDGADLSVLLARFGNVC